MKESGWLWPDDIIQNIWQPIYLSDLFSISNSWFLKDKYLLTGVRVNHDFYQATFGDFFFFFKTWTISLPWNTFGFTWIYVSIAEILKAPSLLFAASCIIIIVTILDWHLSGLIYSSKNHLYIPFEFNRTYCCLKMPEGNHKAEKGKLTILGTLFLEFQQFISALGLSLSPISRVQVFKILQSTKPQPLSLMPAQEMKYQFTS